MNMPFEAPSLNPLFQVEYASAGIPRMVQQLRHTVGDPIETKLPALRAPALVVRGRHDQTLSQPWAEEFTRLLPDGRLMMAEGAAHNRSPSRRAGWCRRTPARVTVCREPACPTWKVQDQRAWDAGTATLLSAARAICAWASTMGRYFAAKARSSGSMPDCACWR